MGEMTLEQQRAVAMANARRRAAEAGDTPVNEGVRNPVLEGDRAASEMAKAQQFTAARTHESRMKSDPYYATAQQQGPVQNALSAVGGVFKGLGYTGPRQILGINKPGEYEDWKASMEGLNSTTSGKVGSFAGYALPVAATAPVTGASAMGAGLAAGTEAFLDPADSTGQRLWKTGLGAVSGGAGQKVANVIGNKVSNARAERQLRSYPGAETVQEETLRDTLQAGYKLPPSAAGKQSFLESVSGQIKTQQAMSDFNQDVTDHLIRRELGDASRFGYRVTPNTPLTSSTLKEIRQAAAQPYADIKALGTLPLIKGRTAQGNPIATTLNARDTVESIKQLRHDGYAKLSNARASGDPDALKQAKALLDDAGKLEDKLETALDGAGQKKLLEDLRAARQLIAKTYNVQDAVRESVGRVDARELGSLFEAGEKGFGPKLTGNLGRVGKSGSAFRESMGMRGFESPRYSALDFAVGGMNAATSAAHGNPVGVLAGGLPLLRGLARDKLLSAKTQATLLPKRTPPGALMKAAPWLFDYTPNLPGIGPYPVSRTIPPSLIPGLLLTDTAEK